jgi:tetratricopeptide (TPR) repeat protein
LSLLATKDGRISVVTLGPEGVDQSAAIDVFNTEAWAPPTISGDVVFARDREALAAISLAGAASREGAPQFLLARRELFERVRSGGLAAVAKLLEQWRQQSSSALNQSSQLRAAQSLADADDLEGASVLLRAINQVYPGSVVGRAKLGRLLLTNGDRDAARSVYAEALELDPNFGEGRRILAQLDDARVAEGNVTFALRRVRDAKLVTVAGSFNNWDPFHTFLRPNGSSWETRLELPPGKYEYKFVVDGNWMLDPANPNRKSDGGNNVNSVLVVEE